MCAVTIIGDSNSEKDSKENGKNEQREEESNMHPNKRKLRPRPEPIPTTSQQPMPTGVPQPTSGQPNPDKPDKPENPYEMFLSIRRQVSVKYCIILCNAGHTRLDVHTYALIIIYFHYMFFWFLH